MIPHDWLPHRRADGELVGYLVPEPADTVADTGIGTAGGIGTTGGGLAVPATLIGVPLGPPQDPDTAAKLLSERGLAALNRTWWCLLPAQLTAGIDIDVTAPEPEWVWRQVVLVEVSPAGGRLRLALAEPAELAVQVAVPVPTGTLLRERQPD